MKRKTYPMATRTHWMEVGRIGNYAPETLIGTERRRASVNRCGSKPDNCGLPSIVKFTVSLANRSADRLVLTEA